MVDGIAVALEVMAKLAAEANDIAENMTDGTASGLESKRRVQELARRLAELQGSLGDLQGVVHVNPDVDIVSHHPVFPPPHSH